MMGYDPDLIDADNTDKRRIHKLENDIYAKQLEEAGERRLRREHPALQEAWERYLVVRAMVIK